MHAGDFDLVKQKVEMEGDSVVIPLKQAGKLILFEMEIDGLSGNVVLDSGASGLVLNETYYRDYAAGDKILVGGIGSNEAGASRTLIKSMRVRSVRFQNVTADVIPLGHLEDKRNTKIIGLFGLAQLTNFIVELDLQRLQLVIRKLPIKASFDPTFSLPMSVSKRCIMLDVSIQDIPLRFALDTGAETNVLNTSIPQEILRTISIQRRAMLTDSTGDEFEVLFATLASLKVGEFTFGFVPIILTNLHQMSEIYLVELDGILGYDFLRNGKVVMNFQTNQFDMYLYE